MPEENSHIIKLEDIEFNERINSVLPRMSEEEFQELKENVVKAGELSSPLIVWKGTNILLDRFSLYRILQENPDVRYRVREIELYSWYDAFKWIYQNPFKHRYTTHENRLLVIGSAYKARMDSVASHGNQYVKRTGQYVSTRELVADDFGISANAVRTAVEVTKAVDEAEAIHPGFWEAYRDGELKTGVKELKAITKATEEKKTEIVESIFTNDTKQKIKLGIKAPASKCISIIEEPEALQSRTKELVDDFHKSIQNILTCFTSEIKTEEGCRVVLEALSKCEDIIIKYRNEIPQNKAGANRPNDSSGNPPDEEETCISLC